MLLRLVSVLRPEILVSLLQALVYKVLSCEQLVRLIDCRLAQELRLRVDSFWKPLRLREVSGALLREKEVSPARLFKPEREVSFCPLMLRDESVGIRGMAKEVRPVFRESVVSCEQLFRPEIEVSFCPDRLTVASLGQDEKLVDWSSLPYRVQEESLARLVID